MHGFETVQEFYTSLKSSQNAFYKHQEEADKWDKPPEKKATPKTESLNERLQRYQKEAIKQHTKQTYHSKEKGAR